MARFYQNLLGRRPGLMKPMPKAEALHEAKEWLRDLTQDQAGSEMTRIERGIVRPLAEPVDDQPVPAKPAPPRSGSRPFAHPYYWAAFILIGDPE